MQSVASTASKLPPSRTQQQPLLGVKRKVWRRDDDHAHLADASFTERRSEVLQRDSYTCRFCTFKAAKYQEVHHLDDNHQNNAAANLLTCCTLCHQVHHLGMCGMRNAGFIAALPELTQTEVNHLARAIFVAELVGSADVRERLRSLYAIFEHRGVDTLKGLYGIDISSPLTFAQLLSDEETFSDALYERRSELLAPLRLVPTKEAFHAGQLEYYAANNRALFLPEHWPPLTRQLL